MSANTSPFRTAPLVNTLNSPRASPFRRPESSLTRTPSTIRTSTSTITSPLKHSNTSISDSTVLSPTTHSSPTRPNSISRTGSGVNEMLSSSSAPRSFRQPPSSTTATITPSIFATSKNHSSRPPNAATTGRTTGARAQDPLSHLPPSLLHTMRESFTVLDRDNTSTVQPADVSDMLTQLNLDASPSALAVFFPGSGGGVSATSGGGINLATYLNTLASSLAPLSDPAELLAAFGAFDDDDSGQIGVGELRDALVGTVPEGGGRRLSEGEIERVIDGFKGRRAFGKGVKSGLGGAGGGREEVFRYREFVGAVSGSGSGSGSGVPGEQGTM